MRMKLYLVAACVSFVVLIISEAVIGANSNDLIVVNVDTEESDSDVEVASEDDLNHEKFIPTKDWQTIKPGQAIPTGLHVRIDLQSGKKEAKLLDESTTQNEDNTKASAVDERSEFVQQHQQKFNTKEMMKEALKMIKNDEPTAYEETTAKFRTIEELKKEFASLKMNIKTESEILAELMDKYRSGHDKSPVLQDLEYLLHQYDLAQDFVKMGGIQLLLPDFNSTESKIRSLAAFTLGSAMQGNPRVQISVLESSVMPHLLRLISFDEYPEVQARSLYALSCLLRNFPAAQKNFIENGGVSALAKLFKHQEISSVKLQVKVITLLHDLLSEQYLTEQLMEKSDKIQQEKLRQYKSFQLEASLKENGFCAFLPKLLGASDHDTLEKVITAMQTLASICRNTFAGSLDSLKRLKLMYRVNTLKEIEETSKDNDFSDSSDELYFLNMYNSLTDLISRVEQPKYKDEL